MPRGGTAAQLGQLGEHEPDPVRPLAARAQLGEHRVVDAVLGVDEPLQVELGGHDFTVAYVTRKHSRVVKGG